MKTTTRALALAAIAAVYFSNQSFVLASASPSQQNEATTILQPASNPNAGATISSGKVVDHLTDLVTSNIKPTAAGVAMDTSKKINSSASQPASVGSEWFKNPAIYGNYQYISTDDLRGNGFDGMQNVVQAGFDFETVEGIIVGALYTGSTVDFKNTFNNDNRIEGSTHFFNVYAAKSFGNWFNLGLTLGYGKSFLDQVFNGAGGGRVQDESDTYTATPFVSLFHTFGAWSFASTPTLILQSNSNGAKTVAGVFAPQVDQSSSLFSWRNKVEYALCDKWALGLKADYNQVLTQYGIPATTPANRADDNWVTFGPKVIWTPSEKWEVNLAYEHDLFNNTYDNHRVSTGLTYSF